MRLVSLMVAASALTVTVGAQTAGMHRAAPHDTLQLDLEHAVSRAVERATPVILGREGVQLSGRAVLESYGRFLPDVRAGASAYAEGGSLLLGARAIQASDARFSGAAYALSTSVNLFNGMRDREHLRAALLEREGAAATLEQARAQVALDVTQAFYQVVLDRRLESVARSTLELSQTRERQLLEQVQAGTRAPPDLYRQQAQTKFDEAAVIDAANRVRADETALLRRLRESPLRPHQFLDPPADTIAIPKSELDPAVLLQHAKESRPDLGAAQRHVAADLHEERVVAGARLPRIVMGLDLVGSGRVFDRQITGGIDQLTTAQRSLASQLGRQVYAVGSIGVSWDVFDRFKNRLDTERAAAITLRDRLVSEDLELQIEGEIQRAVDDYQAATDRLRASASALRASEEAFAAVQGRYDVGLATFVDVLTAQTALTQARAQRAQAVTGFSLQKAVLSYVSGTPPRLSSARP